MSLTVFLAIIVYSGAFTFAEKCMKRFFVNPVLLQCSSCKAKLHYDVPVATRLSFLAQVVWQVTMWMCVWRLRPGLVIGLALVWAMIFPYRVAERRVYHFLWMRRHPVRCEGGGHPRLAPEPS